jgi:hypothetical protein
MFLVHFLLHKIESITQDLLNPNKASETWTPCQDEELLQTTRQIFQTKPSIPANMPSNESHPSSHPSEPNTRSHGVQTRTLVEIMQMGKSKVLSPTDTLAELKLLEREKVAKEVRPGVYEIDYDMVYAKSGALGGC